MCTLQVYEGMMKKGRMTLLPWTQNILALLMGRMSVFLAAGGERHNMSELLWR